MSICLFKRNIIRLFDNSELYFQCKKSTEPPNPPPPGHILALILSRDHDLNKLKLTLAMDASTYLTAFWPIGF